MGLRFPCSLGACGWAAARCHGAQWPWTLFLVQLLVMKGGFILKLENMFLSANHNF
jgi:hypothetical protein